MTSFIDLMASDVWSDADITRRTEAMLRTEFSQEAETILNRKALGYSMGSYSPSLDELGEMARYTAAAQAAHNLGVSARADMALLSQVLALEEAHRRIAMPAVEGDEADAVERQAAQAVIDAAGAEAVDLFNARHAQV